MTAAIGDYAVIGDGRTCALVAPTGSIDFLCWPRFDSDACLCALLGDESHGFWKVAPRGYVTSTAQRYRGDTLILQTEFATETGRVRLTDFMPWQDRGSSVVRRVEGLEGSVVMSLRLRLRFGYGQVSPWIQAHQRGAIAEVGDDRVVLDSPVPPEISSGAIEAEFSLNAGDRRDFILSYSASTDPLRRKPSAERLLTATETAWTDWIGGIRKGDAIGRWADPVKRSLLTLRALVDRRSGGIVAAATLGLPEIPSGAMNWDYRYCWLRDSTFTLTAFLNAGLHEEARRWRDWILRAVAADPPTMQIVYRVDGGRRLHERELPLPGYRGARPVRLGNAASGQIQLDVFGELLDSFDVLAKAGIARTPRVFEVETAIVRHLETVWDHPSSDIWESRGPPARYTYSQAMAWAGIDRYLKAHREDGDPELIGRLQAVCATIHRTVCERGYSSELDRFVQNYGGGGLDASLLLLPLIGFLPADDPRIVSTIAAVERELMDGGFVRRKPADPEGPNEGAFLACSCWLADCYTLQGRDEEAAALLERVIGVANHVGLLSEEYDVPSRSLIGNTPQALTHLALVNSALFLSRPVVQRGGG